MSTEDPTRRTAAPGPAPEDQESAVTHVVGPAPTPLTVGKLVGGRYRITGVLGVGGMGVVYRAHDRTLGIDMALKVLRPEVARDSDFLQRFRNELLVARQVTHRNVVRLHDIGEDQGIYYMSMDLVVGSSLQDLLKDKKKLTVEEAVPIVRQIAQALAEAHRQQVVHRDLKPANILLDEGGEAYVSDFGIARSLETPGITQTGMVLGTPDYLSPEQARGEKVDHRSDIYTLGIMFVQMLSGKLPFPRGTVLEILAQRMTGKNRNLEDLGIEVSPDLEAVIDRCIAKDPEDRYQDTDALDTDLQNLGQKRPRRRLRRRTLRLASQAAAVLVLAAVGAWSLDRWVRPLLERPTPAETAPAATAPAEAPPAAPEAEPARFAVAVLPFADETGSAELAWASTGTAELLALALAESEDLRVVDSLKVFHMLDDLGLDPERLRDDQVAQLVDSFQINRLVLGRLAVVDGTLRLEARLVEADRPGSPSHPLTPQGDDAGGLFALLEGLGDLLRAELELAPLSETSGPPTASTAAMHGYSEGLGHLARGETLKAAPALARAVAEDPGFAAAWVRLAKAYRDLGRLEDAADAARRAVETAGTSGRLAFEARAQEALLRGDPEAAQALLGELVARYPNDTEAHLALADAYGQQGRFQEATLRLERTVRIDPSEPRAWYLLGRYAIGSGEARRAVDEYLTRALVRQKTLRNEQGQAEVYNALGVGYQRLGMPEEASESYSQAAEIRRRIGDSRGLATTLENLGHVYLARGDSDAAESHFQQSLDLHVELGNPVGTSQLYNAFGTLEEERGRYAEALEWYRRSLQVRRDLGDEWALAESHNNVGYAFYVLGEYDNAVLYFEKALALYESNEVPDGVLATLQSLGFCQVAQGRWPEALQTFGRSLELARELRHKLAISVALDNLGLVAGVQGRYPAALSSYSEALAIVTELGDRRGQVEVALHEAETLLELGRTEAAAQRIEQVRGWQSEGGNQEQRARFLALEGHLLLRRGETAASERFSESLREAEASNSPVARVTAQVGGARAQLAGGDPEAVLAALGTARQEAQRLGHALLQLHAAEALAEAMLAAGDPESAADALRPALRISRDGGSYGRAYRLHALLAAALRELGDTAGADAELRRARAELDRLRQDLDEQLGASFEALPEVRELAPAP